MLTTGSRMVYKFSKTRSDLSVDQCTSTHPIDASKQISPGYLTSRHDRRNTIGIRVSKDLPATYRELKPADFGWGLLPPYE